MLDYSEMKLKCCRLLAFLYKFEHCTIKKTKSSPPTLVLVKNKHGDATEHFANSKPAC